MGGKMLGSIILAILIIVEIVFMVLSFTKNSNLKREKSIIRISLFITFLLLVIAPVIDWGFQWYMLGTILVIQAVLGILVLVRKKQNAVPKKSKVILVGLNRIVLIIMALVPTLIFPQYSPIKTTGEYSVGTKSYTITDESRQEYFTEADDKRKVTIQYWYPVDKEASGDTAAKSKFPLVIFSHGAFGYRMSNYSTYQELASNGYIVCSIDHTYHAFMTKQEDGSTIIANMDFINSAMAATNGDISAEETYKLQKDWMKLRTGDMAFVLDYIRKTAVSNNADALYKSMDLDHIGLMGHSLGGATAARIGRTDKDIDAVAVIDGTMLGEITGFENGKDVVSNVPYPKPIMNFYNEEHYKDALADKENYPNMVAAKNALDSYQVVIKGSGHMNFTDLAIISPFLSKMLGGLGPVDSRYALEKLNEDLLRFFDHYLKSSKVEIPREVVQ
jgi:dienelactone hydrolase